MKGNGRPEPTIWLQQISLKLAALVFIIAAFLFMCTAESFAASNFIIRSYDIDMTVNEDDTYDIHEKLLVEFTAPSHGIYRTIPYRTRLDRDGQVSSYYAKITNFKMLSGQPVKLENRDGGAFYRIGDPDKYAETETTYEYTYTYDTRGDHLNGGDEVYYNMVGTSWEAQSIDKVHFRVTFPKEIDMSKVGIKTGEQEYVEFDTEDDLVVEGTTDKETLGGLTIRAVLPEGYFTREAKTSSTLLYVLIGAIVILIAAAFVLWRKYGIDPDIVEPVEFYPPKGMTAAEVGYLDRGEITGEQVVSTLLTLADKGYLKITEKKYTTKFLKREKTDYTITKLKEYDGSVIGEGTFMNGLFAGSSKSVDMSDLTNTFFVTIDSIKEKIQKKYEDKLNDKKAEGISWTLRGLGTVAMILLIVIAKIANGTPFIIDGDFFFSVLTLVATVLLPVLGAIMISNRVNSVRHGIGGVIVIVLGLIVIALGIGSAIISEAVTGVQFIPYLIALVLIFVLFLIAAFCERKSDFYAKTLGEIRGYKRFLKTAEKDRIEALAEEDPDYYYKTLAYAFALGVTSAYAIHFAPLANRPPDWYESDTMYTSGSFNSMSMMSSMTRMMNDAGTSMTSSPDSDGSGGGSFSGGGGGGGGGGGSW